LSFSSQNILIGYLTLANVKIQKISTFDLRHYYITETRMLIFLPVQDIHWSTTKCK